MFKYLNYSVKFVIILFVVAIFFIFSTLWYFSVGLPDYKKLSNYQPPISSRVYSHNSKLIAEYALEKRLFIPFESIPKKVVNAFLAAEDKNFFSHPGIDAKGIIRATIKNVKNISQNKRLEGASTITQQVAKNFLLTNEVSMKRKIKEAILAFRIERAYTKERILELYLNQIYLGQGTYGIAAASLEYFDRSIKELNYSGSLSSTLSAFPPKSLEKKPLFLGAAAVEDLAVAISAGGDMLAAPGADIVAADPGPATVPAVGAPVLPLGATVSDSGPVLSNWLPISSVCWAKANDPETMTDKAINFRLRFILISLNY